MPIIVFHTLTISECLYNKCYSSLRTFSATSCSNLLTTSSTTDSAMFIISSASFISRSARGSNGSSGGDNSAKVGKVNQSQATKLNAEAKRQKAIPIRFSRSVAYSTRLASTWASWVSFSFFFIISWAISRPPFTQTSLKNFSPVKVASAEGSFVSFMKKAASVWAMVLIWSHPAFSKIAEIPPAPENAQTSPRSLKISLKVSASPLIHSITP
jgi:hypothetical protein